MFVHCLVHVFEQVPPETFHITSMAGVHVPHGIVYFDCLVDEVDPNHDPVVASDVGWNVEVGYRRVTLGGKPTKCIAVVVYSCEVDVGRVRVALFK